MPCLNIIFEKHGYDNDMIDILDLLGISTNWFTKPVYVLPYGFLDNGFYFFVQYHSPEGLAKLLRARRGARGHYTVFHSLGQTNTTSTRAVRVQWFIFIFWGRIRSIEAAIGGGGGAQRPVWHEPKKTSLK
jgi:hypothetical protein